mgnify:CR=1 FL=1
MNEEKPLFMEQLELALKKFGFETEYSREGRYLEIKVKNVVLEYIHAYGDGEAMFEIGGENKADCVISLYNRFYEYAKAEVSKDNEEEIFNGKKENILYDSVEYEIDEKAVLLKFVKKE